MQERNSSTYWWAVASTHDQQAARNVRDCCGHVPPPFFQIVPNSDPTRNGLPLRGDYAYEIIVVILNNYNGFVKNKTTDKTLPLRSCAKRTDVKKKPVRKLLDCVREEMIHRLDLEEDRATLICKWLNRHRSFSQVVAKITKSYRMIGADVYFINRDYEGPTLQKRRGLFTFCHPLDMQFVFMFILWCRCMCSDVNEKSSRRSTDKISRS